MGDNRRMDIFTRKISELMAAMETELRRLALWETLPPAAEDLNSAQPFCCDTLAFPQWLQWIFLPRMRDIVAHNGPYPAHSGIYAYAEEWAMHQCVDGLALLHLIKRFDELIEGRVAAGRDR